MAKPKPEKPADETQASAGAENPPADEPKPEGDQPPTAGEQNDGPTEPEPPAELAGPRFDFVSKVRKTELKYYRVVNHNSAFPPCCGLAVDESEAIALVVEHYGGQSAGHRFTVERLPDP